MNFGVYGKKEDTVPHFSRKYSIVHHQHKLKLYNSYSYFHNLGIYFGNNNDIIIGTIADITAQNSDIPMAAVSSVLFIIGIYNFLIFLNRRDDLGSLYLSFFCLLLSLRTVAFNLYLNLFSIWPSVALYNLTWDIISVTPLAAIAFYYGFLRFYFPVYFPKHVLTACIVISSINSLWIILAPVQDYRVPYTLL